MKSPLGTHTKLTLAERFAYYLPEDLSPAKCWEWQGYIWKGYSRLTYKGRLVMVYRLSYELRVGPIPDGYEIDHLCCNRACVNPAHLEAVTKRTNILRSCNPPAENARKTHCSNGHPFDEANVRHARSGQRVCRMCQRMWGREWARKHRAEQKAQA